MVLGRVQVDNVDPGWALKGVRQDVVTRGADAQDDVVGLEAQDSFVDASVLPGKRIDVLIIELGMLLQLVVIVDAPVVVLVEKGGEGQIGRQVHHCSIEGF